MDILDIFGDEAKKPAPSTRPAVADPSAAELAAAIGETFEDAAKSPRVAATVANDLPDHLIAGAAAAANAHDEAASANARYKAAAEILQKKMEAELAELKVKRTEAFEGLSEALGGLLDNMDKANITKIPMADRPDIVVKVSPGRRKSITKKWLVEAYGNEEAKKIWDNVPTTDPKREVIVPDRYEDEPDSY